MGRTVRLQDSLWIARLALPPDDRPPAAGHFSEYSGGGVNSLIPANFALSLACRSERSETGVGLH